NPMGGCLPMLIQMPILIMLYNIVINPLYYVLGKAEAVSTALSTYATTARAAGGLGLSLATEGNGASIELLSKLPGGYQAGVESFAYYSNGAEWAKALEFETPNFSLFGLNMGMTPSFTPAENINYWLLLIPALTFVAYFFSMKINRKLMYQPAMDAATSQQVGCSNKMMDITMPLMSVFICFITPAAIGIYWIFKCLIGVGKQFIIHKAMPLPVFTEEDYKQAEREMKAKSKGQRLPTVVQAPNGQQYRSLHHIDDEDDLPPRGSVQKSEVYVDEDEDEAPKTEAKPESKMAAPLKDDRKNDRKK
ncbi:MAG: YidC/Oxa1 family membrane protein insertase, partial [Clostridia bacterium]|nr:YidC/Oxa1 family membrane protein insertase [Clostridia bacterium]